MVTLRDAFSPLGKTFSVPSTLLFMIQDWFRFNVAILLCSNLHFSLEFLKADSGLQKKICKFKSFAQEFIKAALYRQNKYSHNHSILQQMAFFSVSVYSDHSAVCYVNEIESLKRKEDLNFVTTLREKTRSYE